MSHLLLRRTVRSGDVVVDATCGRGHDTLFLARLVGSEGKVWAFDVQQEALTAAEELLSGEGCLSRVTLVHAGHERLAEYVREPVRAMVFNLGFLPGGGGGIVTRPHTTLAALKQAANMLLPRGILAVSIYTGHPGGAEEAAAVEQWAAQLPFRTFHAWLSRQLNRSAAAPYLVLVEKLR
jgi:SAM-dependent methyltransferase